VEKRGEKKNRKDVIGNREKEWIKLRPYPGLGRHLIDCENKNGKKSDRGGKSKKKRLN